jgi:ATP synthase F1 gamma subunit
MAYLAEIKKEIEFYKDFSSLVETLKNLALFQFHTAQRDLGIFDMFPKTVESFFGMLDAESINHPFLQESKKGVLGVVAITSDAGLLGGLNNRVMNIAMDFSRERKATIIVIGKQGQKYVRGTGVSIVTLPGVEDNKRALQAMQLRDYIVGEATKGNLSSVKIVYPRAFSLTSQKIEVLTLLPLNEWLPKTAENTTKSYSEILLESSITDIVEYLVYLFIGQKIYEILGLSRLAEYAARYIHLEESTDKIKEDIKKLQLKYFKIRHEIIDQQMRELSAAKAIFKG